MAFAFSLHCLGCPALFTASGEPVRFRTRKHFALLVRLALEPEKQFTRDYLADLLWPDVPPRHANHSLAQGLSVIKAKIARDAVVIQRATVGLASGWVDVDTSHLASGDVKIGGPFLEGFEIPGARPFEEWKDEQRARLIPQLRDCLVRQMDAARRIGDYATVEQHATCLQDLDPLAEEAVRGVMEARAWASDRSSALKAFARYEAQLAEELDAKPSADLVRMADLLRDGRPSARPVVAGYPPERIDRRFEPGTLIGREREFSVLYDAWLQARRRAPRFLIVTSDPGVGKTTLVNAFAASCQMDGAVVARTQAYDAERELPFAVLGELVKQLAAQRAIGSADPEALSELTRISGEILRQFPGVPAPVDWSPELTPLRIADAFLKTVVAAAIECPLLLVVDDMHAADNASMAILHSVMRKLTNARVLLILTARTSELRLSPAPWALTSDLVSPSMRGLELESLTPESAQRLVRRIVSTAPRPDPPVDRLLRASGGNPLAIELLTREWADHGSASLLRDLDALDTQPVQSIGIPRAISAVFERQSRRLDPTIRASLDLAAVLGRRLTEVGLYEAIEMSPGVAAEALSRLRDEGYLREIRGDLEFRNELIRAQAYYAVAGKTRQHLHRRVAELLAQNHSHRDKAISLEIAWHHLRGGDVERAEPFAIEGATAVLAVGAPHGAEEVLKAILDSGQPLQDGKRIRLLLAKALIDQSKVDRTLQTIEEVLSEPSLTPREQAEVALLRSAAEFLVNRDRGSKYCEVAKAALDAAKMADDPALIAESVFECARAGTEEGHLGLLRTAEAEIERLENASPTQVTPMILVSKAFCRFSLGDPLSALTCLHKANSYTPRPNAAHLGFMYSGFGIANLFLGRLDDAVAAYTKALELTRKVGDDARTSIICSNLCTLQMHRGYYDESIRYGKMSIRFGEASFSSTLLLCYTNLMDPYLLTGQEAKALECLEKARSWLVPERRWKLRCTFLLEAASLALIQRNLSLALDLIGQLEAIARGREDALPMPGPYWKLQSFRKAHLGYSDEAYSTVQSLALRWKDSYVFHYLDMLATKAWLECREHGRVMKETQRELSIFDVIGVKGKKALLTLQGFLANAGANSPAHITAATSVS